MGQSRLAIVIPAYNEGLVLKSTLIAVRDATDKLPIPVVLVVVDDGSKDETNHLARQYADVVLTHRYNCGLGAALTTGLEYAKREGCTYAITYDADGQHTPKDILTCYKELHNGNDIVIGSRFLGSHQNMPRMRRVVLWFSNVITFLFFGVWTSDSQSGFRGLSAEALTKLKLKSNRMEVSSEFFAEIRRLNLHYSEIPIHVRYTTYSLQKGQGNTAGFGVLLKLLYVLGR